MTIKKIAFYLMSCAAALLLVGCISVHCCNDVAGTPGGNGGGGGPVPGAEHYPLPSGEPAQQTSPCGPFCRYLLFSNSPSGYTAPSTTFIVELKDEGGTVIPSADYHLLWRKGAQTGCATDLNPNQKRFTSVQNAKYLFTVYFKPTKCSVWGGHEIYLYANP